MERPASDGLPHPEDLSGVAVGQVRGVLAIVAFRRLFTALALSSFGDWLGFLAITALAAQLANTFQGKAYATGAVLVFRLLPSVLFAPLAGAFADRFDRRRTMVISDLGRAALFVSIPLSHSLPWLVAATFLVEAVGLFWIPAKEASVPNIVGRERLEAANQLSLIATYGSAPVAALAFALLGVLTRTLGSHVDFFASRPVDLALYLNAATFLFAAATVARLRIPSPKDGASGQGAAQPSLLDGVREGIAFARTSPLIRGLLVGMLGALAAGGTVIAQGQLFATEVLGGGQSAYGLLFGAVFVGIAGGVALGPRLLGSVSRRRALGPTIVLAGAPLVLMAALPNLFLAVLFTLAVGFFAGTAYVVGLTLLGGEVADELRGRAFGLVQALMRTDLLVVTAVTPFISGVIGQHRVSLPAGLSWTVNGVAVTILLGGLLGMAVGRLAYRQMNDRPGVPLRADLASMLTRTPPGPSYSGTFVALEGGEGAGKSTQARRLADWLRESGHEVVVTREPGATAAGRRLREVLLDPASEVCPRAEALLYAADRAQHVAEVVLPALRRGAIVVTDRYADSSLAYQGAGRDLPAEEVARVSRWAAQGLRPDLTVLLDVDPRVGLARAGSSPDRMEQESLAFHDRVRHRFLDLAAAEPSRYCVVAAEADPDRVAATVRAAVTRLLAASPPQPRPAVPARTAGATG